MPIELHIIDIIWIIKCGNSLDKQLSKNCYANRINEDIVQKYLDQKEAAGNIFHRYIDQYNNWRDGAINKALQSIKDDNEDILFISLDLTSYYYNINIDFVDLKQNTHDAEIVFLYECLEQIHKKYRQSISRYIKHTHNGISLENIIPIGLMSSGILANWYLKDFDQIINDKLRPNYYGRYVDDILILISRPKLFGSQYNEILQFYFKDIIEMKESKYFLKIGNNSKTIEIQKEKFIFQYYEPNHSIAGLELFKKQLEERSSAFRFLPDEHFTSNVGKFAYDVIYSGSANKFRSISGLCENDIELTNYLYSQIMLQRLSKSAHENQDEILNELKKFFKGINILKYSKQWERLYQYSVVINDKKLIKYFYLNNINEIKKIKFKYSFYIQQKIINNLIDYNRISFFQSLSLRNTDQITNILTYLNINNNNASVKAFRTANMLRHYLVCWPLLNYCEDKDDYDLLDESIFLNSHTFKIDDKKIKFTPRYIHLDEWQTLNLSKNICDKDNIWNNSIKDIQEYKKNNNISNINLNLFEEIDKTSNSNDAKISTCKIGKENFTGSLKVGISNLRLVKEDVGKAIRPDSKPNLSIKRQQELYKILNLSLIENCELLIMPEVSIPVSWLPFISTFCRKNQIGLIFGLEHLTIDKTVYNLIIEVLPFTQNKIYKSCSIIPRLKNHYSPEETKFIKNMRLDIPADTSRNTSKALYHKCIWKGVHFTTYNCFELADISHRVLFKSDVDLLVACVFNKDISYFSHILESAVRDIHCYVVQANTSIYGDSCVLQPTSSVSMYKIHVKGGDNNTLLTTTLDIKALRHFQYQSNPIRPNDFFKQLPPGYSHEKVLKRSRK